MTKLLIIASSGVDQVLMAVPDDYDRFKVIEEVEDMTEWRGEIYIETVIDLPPGLSIDTWRPYVG